MIPISSPTLLLDKQKACANIDRMLKKAKANDLRFKPHFKTHQSIAVGEWFKERGVNQITVSSVKMAEYFALNGWTDITIAFPCNVRVVERINNLAGRITLSILVSDPKTVAILRNSLSNKVQVYIEIDTGSDRTGLKPTDLDIIESLLQQITNSETLNFRGFYSHPGHSYSARSKQEIQNIHQDAVLQMQQLKKHYTSGFSNLLCCLGDTPCCSVGEGWEGIDEISAGNFVFYDLMQARIGSCNISDIAVALACPVVSTNSARKEIVVHGGAVHLSKESLGDAGKQTYGKIAEIDNDLSWGEPVAGCYVKSLSQEHGIIKCSIAFFERAEIGDIIGILPVHSCLTADAMKSYTTTVTADRIDHLQSAEVGVK